MTKDQPRRSVRMCLRLTASEKKVIQERAKKANLSMTQYLVAMAVKL